MMMVMTRMRILGIAEVSANAAAAEEEDERESFFFRLRQRKFFTSLPLSLSLFPFTSSPC